MKKGNSYQDLLDNNRVWVAEKLEEDPRYFETLANGQNPPYLFIGCSDSRKPIDIITKTEPGELFIHRNIGNQVALTDLNLLSVLDYAVNALNVKHIIVCGHTCCGAVEAALTDTAVGTVINWVSGLRDLYLSNKEVIDLLPTTSKKLALLSKINVIKQVKNLCKTSILRKAATSGTFPELHGWVFDLETGLISDEPLPLDAWEKAGLIPKRELTI